MRPRLRHKIGLAAFAVMLAVGGLEVGARVYGRLARQDRVLIHDAVLGWKLVAGARRWYAAEEQPYLIEINSRGLRDREYRYEKPRGTFRVLFLGDSFVFGSGGVEQPRLFTELLESSMPGVEAINAGVPGYSLDQELLFLQSEGYRYEPDLVVVGLFLNDFPETFLSFNPSIRRPKGYVTLEGDDVRFHPPVFGVLFRVLQSSYALAWADQRLQIASRLAAGPVVPAPPDRGARRQAFARLLVTMRDFCRTRGAEFAVVRFPFRAQIERDAVQEVLDDLSVREEIAVLDLHGRLEPAADPGSLYFRHDIHLNDRGHVRVAELLREFLSERTRLGTHLR